MKNNLNEVQRLQKIAGILKENTNKTPMDEIFGFGGGVKLKPGQWIKLVFDNKLKGTNRSVLQLQYLGKDKFKSYDDDKESYVSGNSVEVGKDFDAGFTGPADVVKVTRIVVKQHPSHEDYEGKEVKKVTFG